MDEMIRPRLYGDTQKWALIIDTIRELGLETTEKRLFADTGFEFDSQTNTIQSKKSKQITTLEELLTEAKVDLEEWEVERHIVNRWSEFSQVKAWLKRKGLAAPDNSFTEKWLDLFTEKLKKTSKLGVTGKNWETTDTEVVILADLHVGAVMKDSKLIPDYNVKILEAYLEKIALQVNAGGKRIHVVILGDFIESFTGKNKKDTWKNIELHGMEAVLTTFDLLYHFFSSIHNLEKVYMISGNHDRITDDGESDPYGNVVLGLHGMFKRTSSLPVEYDPLIMSNEIDGIQYIFTHGNYLKKKNNAAEIVIDYGNKDLFNLIIGGHLHSRMVSADKLKLRDITAPSLITGTPYEERNNWNSLAGYLRIHNNGEGKPVVVDVPL